MENKAEKRSCLFTLLGQEGQASVEWIGLLLVVAALFGGVTAFGGTEWLANEIECVITGHNCSIATKTASKNRAVDGFAFHKLSLAKRKRQSLKKSRLTARTAKNFRGFTPKSALIAHSAQKSCKKINGGAPTSGCDQQGSNLYICDTGKVGIYTAANAQSGYVPFSIRNGEKLAGLKNGEKQLSENKDSELQSTKDPSLASNRFHGYTEIIKNGKKWIYGFYGNKDGAYKGYVPRSVFITSPEGCKTKGNKRVTLISTNLKGKQVDQAAANKRTFAGGKSQYAVGPINSSKWTRELKPGSYTYRKFSKPKKVKLRVSQLSIRNSALHDLGMVSGIKSLKVVVGAVKKVIGALKKLAGKVKVLGVSMKKKHFFFVDFGPLAKKLIGVRYGLAMGCTFKTLSGKKLDGNCKKV